MNHPTTPEEFCWLYAAGCLEARRAAGTLDKEAYLNLRACLSSERRPPPKLIRDCFPKPFEHIRKHMGLCSLKNMKRYWRVTHDDVYMARVDNVDFDPKQPDLVMVHVLRSTTSKCSRDLPVRNVHGYDLSKTKFVRVHGDVIAEQVEIH